MQQFKQEASGFRTKTFKPSPFPSQFPVSTRSSQLCPALDVLHTMVILLHNGDLLLEQHPVPLGGGHCANIQGSVIFHPFNRIEELYAVVRWPGWWGGNGVVQQYIRSVEDSVEMVELKFGVDSCL